MDPVDDLADLSPTELYLEQDRVRMRREALEAEVRRRNPPKVEPYPQPEKVLAQVREDVSQQLAAAQTAHRKAQSAARQTAGRVEELVWLRDAINASLAPTVGVTEVPETWLIDGDGDD